MTNDRPGESLSQAALRRRLEEIRNDATSLAGVAVKMTALINEVLEKGGTVVLQPQMNFITGAHARMLKDLGLVAYLQQDMKVVVRKPPPTK